jgi:hypothetical protein
MLSVDTCSPPPASAKRYERIKPCWYWQNEKEKSRETQPAKKEKEEGKKQNKGAQKEI